MDKSSKKAKIMVAIFVASMLTQSTNALALILQGVMTTYPGTTLTAAQMVISIATIVSLIGTLVAGKAATIATKKTLLVVFILLEALGGLLGYAVSFDLMIVYIACGLVGLGVGAVTPLTSALIAEYFDGSTRATVMGTQSIFVNGGGVIIQFVGGLLAAMYWKNLFLVFLVGCVVIAIIDLLLLPKGTVEKPPAGEKVKTLTPFLGVMMFQGFFNGVAMMVVMGTVTPYIFQLGIGTEAEAGFVTTLFAVGAVIAGVCIALIMKACKRYVFAIGLTMSALGLWVFSFGASLPLFFVAAFLVGVGFTMHNTPFYTLAAANAHPAAVTMTMSLYGLAMGLGVFICPIVITPLAASLSPSLGMCFTIGAIVLSVVAIIAYFTPKLMKNAVLTLGPTPQDAPETSDEG